MIQRADQIGGILLLVFSLLYTLEARKLPSRGMNALFFGQGSPGPNFLPYWLGVTMIVLAIALVVSGTLRPFEPGSEEERLPGVEGWKRLAVLFGALVLYFLVMPVIGFSLGTLALLTALLVFPDRHPVLITFGLPIGTTLILHWLFLRVLHVALPTNALGF